MRLLNKLLLTVPSLILTACVNTEFLDHQLRLVENQTDRLLEEKAGRSDMYFVGFAADSVQKVFRKEIQFTQSMFDRDFHTLGRSAVLINSKLTKDVAPMATYQNLNDTLHQVANKMNREEDILFLFLTGHGIRGEGLSVGFGNYHQEVLSPQQLKTSLMNAGIKWKVIVVSACYSGQFKQTLADGKTLVITASDAENPSFGCTNTADMTFFGEAFFQSALSRTRSFTEAYNIARYEIEAKEDDYGYPHSNPSISSSHEIENKISHWRKQNFDQ